MSNSWWEIKIVCNPVLEESIIWRLDKFGCSGTARESENENYLIRAYIPEIKVELLDLSALVLWLAQDAAILEMPAPEVSWNLIYEEDWASSWKQHWQPTEIGDRFLVYPAWLTPPEESERLILRLDPGSAFGTGTHATTQLCLESLEMRFILPTEDSVIADIGCGSGILSIGALLLGAKQVYAVDIDPLAVKATDENAQLNNIDRSRLLIKEGSIDVLQNIVEQVDGIVCNILAETILQLMPEITALAKPKTWGVLSGILFEQADPITDSLEAHGWVVATLWKRKQWCCFNIRRA